MANLALKAEKHNKKQFDKSLSVIEKDNYLEIVDKILKTSSEEDIQFLNGRGFNIPYIGKTEKIKKFKEDFKSMVTIGSIKNICLKYDMKFLPIKYYKGVLPSDIAQTIRNFEKNKVNLQVGHYFMLAPKESFNTVTVKINPDPILCFVDRGISVFDGSTFEGTLDTKVEVVKIFGSNFTLWQRIKGLFRMNIDFVKLLNILFGVLTFSFGIYYASVNSQIFDSKIGFSYKILLISSVIIPIIIHNSFIGKYDGEAFNAYLREWCESQVSLNE